MKVILICLLLATVAFADIVESSDVSFLPYLALANQFLGEKLNVQFNATEFALGLNQGFGLATNEAALACANSVVPALEYLEVVSQEITQLQWGQVFNQTSTLINNVQEFQTECETVYNSYADYFGAAADAYNNDQEAFLKAVRANLLQDKATTILQAVQVIVAVVDNDDVNAGQSAVTLIQTALQGYLPN